MGDITQLLHAAADGQPGALDQVIETLYGELHRLARSRMRRSGDMTLLDTTALVNEAWMRFREAGQLDFPDRRYFLGYAARVMRALAIDAARARMAVKRGGADEHVTLDTFISESVVAEADEVLKVHEALEELAEVDERLARVVEMRYFGGLSEREIAECLEITERTVQRDWHKARLYLAASLRGT